MNCSKAGRGRFWFAVLGGALVCVVLIGNIANAQQSAAPAPEGAKSAQTPATGAPSATVPEMKYEAGKLSLKADKVDLVALLKKISLAVGVPIEVGPGVSTTVTVEFVGLNLEEGINRILAAAGEKNLVTEYTKKTGQKKDESIKDSLGSSEILITKIRILPKPTQMENTTITEQIIKYEDSAGLTVKVRNMDMMQVFREIEKETDLHSRIRKRIVTKSKVDQLLTIEFENKPLLDGINQLVFSIVPGRHDYRVLTGRDIKEPGFVGKGTIIEIYKLSESEETALNSKIKKLSEEGRTLFENKSYFEALNKFDAILIHDSRNLEALKYKGKIVEKFGRGAHAEEYFIEYLKRNPNDPEPYYHLGRIELRKFNPDGALSYLTAYDKLGPEGPDKETARNLIKDLRDDDIRAYLKEIERSESLVSETRLDEAEKILRGLIGKRPSRPEAYSSLGDLYFIQRNTDGAIEMYERLAIISPKESLYLFLLAQLFMEKANYEVSLRYLDKILEKNPGPDTRSSAEQLKRIIADKRKGQK